MASQFSIFIWMLLMAVSAAVGAFAQDVSSGRLVPSFTVHELRSNQRSDEFKTILQTTGLISVVMDDNDDGELPSSIRQEALGAFCRCQGLLRSKTDENNMNSPLQKAESVILRDGSTVRTTVATALIGNTPLTLPNILADSCGTKTVQSMEHLRDLVARAANVFVEALDKIIGENGSVSLLRDAKGNSYRQVASIVAVANHLEHFHVYNKDAKSIPASPATSTNQKQKHKHTLSLDWHTDAGLFLAFMPAFDCADSLSNLNEDKSFWFKDEHGVSTRAKFLSNSIAIMLGAGAEHWLQSLISLKATRHAVAMQEGDQRAWYGIMYLVPESAIVQESPRRTFLDMKKSLAVTTDLTFNQDSHSISIGCGAATASVLTNISRMGKSPIDSSRRRLQHVSGPSACNNSTNFFCWMSCLDIPNIDQAENYVKSGHSLYCLDPSVLASSGNDVSQAVAECPYGVHNARCLGSWQLTVPDVPSTKVIYNSTVSVSEQFCYGGTSMYMDGFHWIDSVCIIYLFPDWILNTTGKFVAASIGSLLLGILLEGIIMRRRMAMTTMQPGAYRLTASALFYGLQLTVGYFGMLVVMTYSGPLFMCIIFGIVGGHLLFNAQDAVLAPKQVAIKAVDLIDDASDGDKAMDCCAINPEHTDGQRDPAKKSYGALNQDEPKSCVPEGSTPCCQHIL